MLRTRIAPPLALLVGACAAAGLAGPAAAAPAAPAATTVRPWLLVGTARGGMALVVDLHGYDGCTPRPTVAAVETPTAISVTVSVPAVTVGPVACPDTFTFEPAVVVPLKAEVGGRRIVGPMREASTPFAAYAPTTDPFRKPAPVPEVRGLRRLDAHRVLCAWGFATRTPGSRPGATSPIVGQTPSAGTRATPLTAAQLRRRTSVPDCTGDAWTGAPRVVLLHGPR